MRQRKIKDIENKIAEYEDLMVENPEDWRGNWRNLAGDHNKVYLEIGCGKGDFIVASALEDHHGLYIAAEGVSSVVYRALAKVREQSIDNVKFVIQYVQDMDAWFEPGELNGIFLNFSDPWPKARNGKRRLTHATRLAQYSRALAPEGFIKIKTDNDGFFDFTLGEIEEYNRSLEVLMESEAGLGEGIATAGSKGMAQGCRGLVQMAATRDLRNSPWASGSPMTEYEKKFVEQGIKINYVELKTV